MADIVYDLHGDGGNDGKGTLFKGMKAFFLMRVPMRDHWMSLVKANGGEIVKLEKQADIVIADHARKDAPAESISWKFIEHSIKEGKLKDIALYEKSLAQTAQRSPHSSAVASSQQPRMRRTAFTEEDDRILAEWVTKAELSGEVTRGNILYQQLELHNNRHTAQSWRDRWVKYVSLRPRPSVAAHDSLPDARAAQQSSASNVREPSYREITSLRRPPLTKTPRSLAAPTRSPRQTFPDDSSDPQNTREEGSHDDISTREIKFTDEDIELLVEAGSDIMNLDEDRSIDAWITWANEYPSHTAQEWRNCFNELVEPRLREESKSKTKRVFSHNEAKKGSAIALHKPKKSSRRETDSSLLISDSDDAAHAKLSMTTEQVFRRKLATIAEVQGEEAVFTATVCGRAIPLYEFWQTIQSDELGGFSRVNEKRLWPVVARKLNFSDFQHRNAAKELELCYKDTLLILDDAHREFERLPEEQMAQIQLLEKKNPPGYSSPIKAGRESHDTQPLRKRPRIDKGKEAARQIPGALERLGDEGPVRRPSYSSGRSRDASRMTREDEEEDSEPELFVRPFKKINLSPTATLPVASRQTTEPETQDFHYSPEQHDESEPLSAEPTPPPKKAQSTKRNTMAHKKNASTESSSRRRSETRVEAEGEPDLNTFVEQYISAGYEPVHVITALEATSMDTGDAGIVMKSLQARNGVPRNIQGVWTSSDDEAVEEKGHPKFRDAVLKHGMDRVHSRRRFLADQRASREKLAQVE